MQLSAEQRYDQQDAEHERSTRELREQLAAAQDALRMQTEGALTELSTLTTAVTETRDTVQDVATRLGKVERRLAASPATAAAVPVVATSKAKPPKSKKPRECGNENDTGDPLVVCSALVDRRRHDQRHACASATRAPWRAARP